MTRLTSIQAYNKIVENGLLSKRRLQVFEFIVNNAPCTQKQAWEHFRADHHSGASSGGGITSRFVELERLGVIEEVDQLRDPDTGMMNTVYDVTGKMPDQERMKKIKNSHKETWVKLLDALVERGQMDLYNLAKTLTRVKHEPKIEEVEDISPEEAVEMLKPQPKVDYVNGMKQLRMF